MDPDLIELVGNSQQQLAVSNVAAQTGALPPGRYAVWCDALVYVKVSQTADDVTVTTGMPIFPGNVIKIEIPSGNYRLGGVLSIGANTLRFHRVGGL